MGVTAGIVTESECRPQVGWRYWERRENRAQFFASVAEEFNIREATDWKNVTTAVVRERGGSGLLAKFDGSLYDALRESVELGNVTREEIRPQRAHSHWKENKNRLEFMCSLAAAHNLPPPGHTVVSKEGSEEWRQLSTEAVQITSGGAGFLSHYRGSFLAALAEFFGPTVLQQPAAWRKRLPDSVWTEPTRVKATIHSLEERLGIRRPEEWARVSQLQLRAVNCPHILYSSPARLAAALDIVYPSLGVTASREGHKKARQRHLASSLHGIFLSRRCSTALDQ